MRIVDNLWYQPSRGKRMLNNIRTHCDREMIHSSRCLKALLLLINTEEARIGKLRLDRVRLAFSSITGQKHLAFKHLVYMLKA